MSVKRTLLRAWMFYTNSLSKHPVLVPALQTSFLLGAGDILSQHYIEEGKPFDYKRTARFAGIGLCLGPGLSTWYWVLDRVVGRDTSFKTSLKKVALDQLFFAPIVLVVFMGTLSILEGQSFTQFETNLRRNYTDILLNNYKLWPAVQIINFGIVPLKYRVLVVQVVALGWNTYLAWKLHKAPHKHENKKLSK